MTIKARSPRLGPKTAQTATPTPRRISSVPDLALTRALCDRLSYASGSLMRTPLLHEEPLPSTRNTELVDLHAVRQASNASRKTYGFGDPRGAEPGTESQSVISTGRRRPQVAADLHVPGAVSPGHRGVQMSMSALAPMSDPGRVGSAGGRVRYRAGAGIID